MTEMEEAERFEHIRAIDNEHVRALLYDANTRLLDLEADQKLRQLAISVILGLGPFLGILIGVASGVKVQF